MPAANQKFDLTEANQKFDKIAQQAGKNKLNFERRVRVLKAGNTCPFPSSLIFYPYPNL
jgi:hypothetical protein